MTNSRITESAIEVFAIELLEKQGIQYVYGSDLAPDSDTAERESFEDVLLLEHLREAVARINPAMPPEAREDALKQVLSVAHGWAFCQKCSKSLEI